MKRVIIAILCFSALSFSVFATSADCWKVFAFEGENSFESVDGNDTKFIHSMGLNYSTYKFEPHRFLGLYAGSSLYFPYKLTNEVSNEEYDRSDFNFLIGYRGTIGPALKFPVLPLLTLKVAAGFSFGTLLITDDNYRNFDINLGIGGDLGLRLSLTRNWSLECGTKVGYDFFNYHFTKVYGHKDNGRTKDYRVLRMDPYIGFGYSYSR